MYETVSRAQAAALKKMRSGARGKSVDATARTVIDDTKYKGRFIHSLGHSVGLAVHDPSTGLSPGSDLVLRPNMVLTNEPGVYLPGFGGVRIEDDVQITRGVPKVLSTAPREFVGL
jgi:Xaa-Pro dipeptidase